MPEKCQYCGEHAVIEDSVDAGQEQRICVECGSLATGLTSKSDDHLNFELADDTLTNTHDDDDNCCVICSSCGTAIAILNDTLCSNCNQENLTDENELSNDNPDSDCDNEIEPTKRAGKSNNKIKCISCNGENLSTEAINGDERLICTDCGSVNSNSVLTAEEFQPLTRTKNNDLLTLPRFHEGTKVVKGLQAGVTEIQLLSSKYCFSDDVKMAAEEMFRKLFHHTDIKNLTIDTKQNIGVACIFIVCRQHDLPISMTHFKRDVNVFKTFLKATRLVLKILDIQLPHISVTNLLTSFLNEIGFGREIAGKVKDILFLYRKAWLTQGRSRESLITIATYYAYVSSINCKEFISFNNFCKHYKIPCPSPRLVRECKTFLLKLAQSLPWVTEGRVTVKTLSFYINDVIRYQESLFHLVFQSVDDDDNAHVQDRSHCFKAEEPKVRPGIKRKETLKPSALKKKRLICQESIQSSVPPGINLDSTELKETEFAEEINLYIMSPEEQANIEEHKMSIWKN